MKITAAVAILVVITLSRLFAETPHEREFNQLKHQRNKAIEVAVDPINRRYQVSLEQLLRKAMQANDLDTALKLKEEMKSAALISAEPSTPDDLSALLKKTEWAWYDNLDNATPHGTVKFLPDGKVETTPRMSWIGGWEAEGQRKFRVRTKPSVTSAFWIFELDANKKEARTTRDSGAIPEDKILKAIRK